MVTGLGDLLISIQSLEKDGIFSKRISGGSLNKVYESSASTFAINDQLKGSK